MESHIDVHYETYVHLCTCAQVFLLRQLNKVLSSQTRQLPIIQYSLITLYTAFSFEVLQFTHYHSQKGLLELWIVLHITNLCDWGAFSFIILFRLTKKDTLISLTVTTMQPEIYTNFDRENEVKNVTRQLIQLRIHNNLSSDKLRMSVFLNNIKQYFLYTAFIPFKNICIIHI